MGIEADSLLERYPELVIGEITSFGKRGPDADLSAMDIVVQARSGLMAATETRSLLAELGFEAGQIEDLINDGITRVRS